MKKYTITVNGTAYDVEVEDNGAVASAPKAAAPVAAAPKAAPAAPVSAEAPAPAPRTVEASGSGEPVQAPVPGLVLRVVAKDGEQVSVGQEILVLEAMKMEIPLKSATAGTVSIAVAAGDKVSTGDVLFTIG